MKILKSSIKKTLIDVGILLANHSVDYAILYQVNLDFNGYKI